MDDEKAKEHLRIYNGIPDEEQTEVVEAFVGRDLKDRCIESLANRCRCRKNEKKVDSDMYKGIRASVNKERGRKDWRAKLVGNISEVKGRGMRNCNKDAAKNT